VELVVVFGLKQEGVAPDTQGKAGEMLRQLEASKSTAIKQDLADELLSEFGFK
jgi:chemotaxis protein CheZ